MLKRIQMNFKRPFSIYGRGVTEEKLRRATYVPLGRLDVAYGGSWTSWNISQGFNCKCDKWHLFIKSTGYLPFSATSMDYAATSGFALVLKSWWEKGRKNRHLMQGPQNDLIQIPKEDQVLETGEHPSESFVILFARNRSFPILNVRQDRKWLLLFSYEREKSSSSYASWRNEFLLWRRKETFSLLTKEGMNLLSFGTGKGYFSAFKRGRRWCFFSFQRKKISSFYEKFLSWKKRTIIFFMEDKISVDFPSLINFTRFKRVNFNFKATIRDWSNNLIWFPKRTT